MASGKSGQNRSADIIKNWIRTRYTLEFLGTWEMLNNPDFKVVEFDHFMIVDVRHIHEADFRRAAAIAIISQPFAVHRVMSWHHAMDLTIHSFHPNFRRLVSGGMEEAGMKGG